MTPSKMDNTSSITSEGGDRGQSAPLAAKNLPKIVKKGEKRKIWKKKQKSGSFFHFTPPDRKGWLCHWAKQKKKKIASFILILSQNCVIFAFYWHDLFVKYIITFQKLPSCINYTPYEYKCFNLRHKIIA